MDTELKKKQSLVKELRKVKAFEIQRLCKRVRMLKGKKGSEQQTAKNERKTNRLLQEIDFLKDVNIADLAEKIMDRDSSEFVSADVEENTMEKRVLCKLTNSKYIRNKLSELKSFKWNEGNMKHKVVMHAGRKDKKLKVHTVERKENNTEKQTVDIGEDSEGFGEEVDIGEDSEGFGEEVDIGEDSEGFGEEVDIGEDSEGFGEEVTSICSDQDITKNGKEKEKLVQQRKDKVGKLNDVGGSKNWPRKNASKEEDNEGIEKSVMSLNFDEGIVESEEEFGKASEGSDNEEPLGGSVFVGSMSQSKEKKKDRKNEKDKNKKKLKSKNRMGQRERRKKWETMYGVKATHKKKERKEKFDARKNENRSSQMGKRKKMEFENKIAGRRINQVEEKLHPSWEASKRRKMQQIVEFQGQKITFNDED